MTAGTGVPPAVTRASGMRAMGGTLRHRSGAVRRRLTCCAPPGRRAEPSPDAEYVTEVTNPYCDESETLGSGVPGHPRTTRNILTISFKSKGKVGGAPAGRSAIFPMIVSRGTPEVHG